MKVLRLPYLAQKEVLKEMEYEELFLISLVSKRSMRMIQSVKRKELTKIDILTSEKLYNFCAGSDKRTIVTLHHESRPTDITLRKEISLGNLVCSMEYKEQLLPHHPSLVIYYRLLEMDTIAAMVYNQLDVLFGSYATFSLNVQSRFDVIPTFLKSSRMSFWGSLNANVLEDYFMNVQEQEYLHITIRGLIGDLSSNSRLYSITGLVMETWHASLATAVLSNFKGRRLILKNVSGIDNEICQFIARWKSCLELENFEYLSVFMDPPGFANIDEIKRIAGFKDLTPEAKAFGQIVRSIHSSYVVRDDGIVAKTHINRRGISMNVRQFTEEQMLKGAEVVKGQSSFKTAMKLLRFPYLAQKEIFKQMMYEELFLMSLISKRLMRTIQSVKRKEMASIEILTLGHIYNFCAGVNKRTFVTLEQESCPSDKALRKTILLRGFACSMEYKQQLLPRDPSLVIYSRFPITDLISTIVCYQLNALFGNYVTFEISINDRYNVLPTFLNVTRSTMVFSEAINAHVLEDYFMNVQEQEHSDITFNELVGNLSPISRLYSSKVLRIKSNYRLLVNNVLSNFKGKELYINGSPIDDEICQFIERWKSSQELKDFELLQFINAWIDFEKVNEIKQRSGFKDLTPELKAFGQGGRSNYTSYIVRDDGIVAKIHINNHMFLLHVQSFTEEQMLKETEVTN
ncbi:hypothetical protein CAEBREN_17710 [Caenorhabditis brenneri]|uniref:F-box domain-containing protein n=1 Tax=Caenorhabditis brenneri TaxID=135651 RepID=G0MEF0_CAEBE|nr:hypothetical protein CAEBREN_17710 [Caenorhabditis brenneri]